MVGTTETLNILDDDEVDDDDDDDVVEDGEIVMECDTEEKG